MKFLVEDFDNFTKRLLKNNKSFYIHIIIIVALTSYILLKPSAATISILLAFSHICCLFALRNSYHKLTYLEEIQSEVMRINKIDKSHK